MGDTPTLDEMEETEGKEFNEDPPFIWVCPGCEETHREGGYLSLGGHERKGIIRCNHCEYEQVIHLWYRDEKLMHDDIAGESYPFNTLYIWTGTLRIKQVHEQDGKTWEPVGIVRLAREYIWDQLDEEDRREILEDALGQEEEPEDYIPQMEEAAKNMGMEDHLENHHVGIPIESQMETVTGGDEE